MPVRDSLGAKAMRSTQNARPLRPLFSPRSQGAAGCCCQPAGRTGLLGVSAPRRIAVWSLNETDARKLRHYPSATLYRRVHDAKLARMKLVKLDCSFIGDLAATSGLKGACVLLPGGLHAAPDMSELPRHLLPGLPAVIICRACDSYLHRLLHQRGVIVTYAKDPVDSLLQGSEVDIDAVAGTLTEHATNRRFALHPLPAALVAEARDNAEGIHV